MDSEVGKVVCVAALCWRGARFGSSGSQYRIDDIPTSSYFATTSCVTVVGLSRFPNRTDLKESLFRRPLSSIASK